MTGRGMAKVTLELPDEVARQVEAMLKRLEETTKAAQAMEKGVDGNAMLASITEATMAVGLELKRRVLQGLDVDRKHVVIGGSLHRKAGRYEATYKTLEGEVTVLRSLYRPTKQVNAKTVDVISARLGAVEDGWLPEAAVPMAQLLAQGTSRDAEAAAKAMKRLPYSRSSFERVGHAVGAQYARVCDEVEAALLGSYEIPDEAHSLSVSLDKVSMPMEEARKRRRGRPGKRAAKRPIAVAYRMAWCATMTLHDEDGVALHTKRYGRMPAADAVELAESLAADAAALHAKRPDLKVCVLTDGAVELHTLLDDALAKKLPDCPAHRLVDFWHLAEKLGAAASLIYGEDEGRSVLARWKVLLLNSKRAIPQLIDTLKASGCVTKRVGETRPVADAIRYMENHGQRMAYSEARRLGLPIGSGNVEATCKSLVGVRMRRPGSRWKEETGQHVLDLRALDLSDCFHDAMRLTLAPLRQEVLLAA